MSASRERAQRTLLVAAELFLATIDTTEDIVFVRRAIKRLRKATDAARASEHRSRPLPNQSF